MAARLATRAPRALALAFSLGVAITCAESVTPPSSVTFDDTTATLSSPPITVTLDRSTIPQGDSTVAKATIQRRLALWLRLGQRITWTSSNTAVATVNRRTGVVIGVGEGSASIVGTLRGISGSAAIEVTIAPPPTHAPVASVSVALGASTINTGSSTTASAVLRDAAGNVLSDRGITWVSSNPAVASIDATSGAIHGLAHGTVQISATSEGVSGQATLNVHAPVASVTVALAASTIRVGGTTSASATLNDANDQPLSDRAIAWSSSNTSVATVDPASGAITAVAEGSAAIRATSEGVTGEASLTVTRVPVASVTVTLAATSIGVGGTTTATAVTRDAGNAVLTGRAVTWSSSNPAVASVNATTGAVSALAEGSANIIATSEDVTGQAALTVTRVPVAAVNVTLAASSIAIGATTNASAVTRDANNNILTGRAVRWSSSNAAVATVDANSGLVTAVAAGSASISAVSEGVTGQASLTVTQIPVASVTVTLNASTLTAGSTTAAVAVARDANNNVLSGRAVTWSSTNTTVATVNASGTVTARAAGTAAIRATSEGVSGQANLTVTAAPVASITVSLAASSIPAGQTTNASAVLRDVLNNILTGRTIAWTSTNTSVATVSASGVVTGVAPGTASIRATSETIMGAASITVTVAAPSVLTDAQLVEDFSSGQLIRGGNGFNDNSGVTGVLSVASTAGLGFPSSITHALRVEHVAGARPGWVAKTGMRAIEVGESILYRFYLFNGISRSMSLNNHHPVESAAGGGGLPSGSNVEFKFDQSGGTFALAFVVGNHAWAPFANGAPARLSTSKVYRVEARLLKTAANTFTPFLRVYDGVTNALLYSEAQMGCTINYDDRIDVHGPGSSVTEVNARNLRFGINGGTDLGGGQYHYFSGIAVTIRRSAAGDVIGPHRSGEGR